MLPNLTNEEIRRYSRHLLVPEIGMAGQKRLKAASALIVGLGGLGSPIALYLAAAGVGRIGLIDHDRVDISNLQRQVIHGSRAAGQPKVRSARERMADLNPLITIETYDALFTRENAMQIAADYDILIDGTDNFPARYLLNDVGVFLHKPVVYGSVFHFDGQVSVFDAERGPCYRCVFPEPPRQAPNCSTAGVLGSVPGVIGTIQATEAIKLLAGVGEPLIGRLLLYNAYDQTFETVRLRKNPRCKVCGEHPVITELVDYEQRCGPASEDDAPLPAEWHLSAQDLAKRLRRGADDLFLLDVRDAHEMDIVQLPGSTNIPLDDLPRSLDALPRDRQIVVLCKRGNRSQRALKVLSEAGFTHICHLTGGLEAWAQEVDDALPRY